MATKVIDEKKRFSYVVTFYLFTQTNVKIMVGNRIYEYVNTIILTPLTDVTLSRFCMTLRPKNT